MRPMQLALITVLAYGLGSVPSAYIVARLAKGIDIRSVGSGNVGALNTFRQIGPGAASLVLSVDIFKGVLAILTAMWIGDSFWACLYGAAGVVAGHNWPVFLGFRGGKGAATALGVSLALLPLLTLVSFAAAVLVALAVRNAVLGAAAGFLLINLLAITTGQGWFQVLLCLSITFVVTATYLGASWQRAVASVQQGRWLDLFSFE